LSKKKKRLKNQASGSDSKIRHMQNDASRVSSSGKRVPEGAGSFRSFDGGQFRWSAKNIDLESQGDWDWELKPSELRDLLCAIEDYSASTWTELILQQGGNRHHSQQTESLSKGAKDRLQQLFSGINSEYPEEIFRFRISGEIRLWGFRENGIFKILWYDRNHKVYPVQKRHT
jgi:hypothetical protein